MRRFSILCAIVATAGCATTGPVPDEAATMAAVPFQIHWVRNSAEYPALFEQTFRLAGAVLERRVEGREPNSWAVVIDADETLISNSEQSKQQWLAPDVPFEDAWEDWVERRSAPALPGARSFLLKVRDLGGRIAVVTNRRERHCSQTADNLRAQGLPFDVILCRGESRDKHPRWASVEAGTASADLPPLEIVMWLGDNIHDFPAGAQDLRFESKEAFAKFGEVFFILPNPLYGSWEDNPYE